MKKFNLLAPYLFVLLCFSGLCWLPSCQTSKSATQSRMLKFGFEQGKGYDYEMITNFDQEIMGQDIKMDMNAYYSMDVVGEQGDTKVIQTTFERLKMTMGVMGMDIEIDTDKPLPDFGGADEAKGLQAINGLMGAVKGRKFIMKVDAEGKVLELSGFENMAKAIADSLQLEGDQRAKMISEFEQQLNNQGMEDQFGRVLYIFPNKEVKVGDSWQKTTTTSGPTGGTYLSTYTVKEIEGDMVTLEEKSKIRSRDEETEMDGEVEGTIVVDSRSGLVVLADQDLDMKITAKGMTINMKGKTKVKGKAR